jgi:hypothetical protein
MKAEREFSRCDFYALAAGKPAEVNHLLDVWWSRPSIIGALNDLFADLFDLSWRDVEGRDVDVLD